MINATTRSTGLDYSSLLICSGQPVPAGVAVRRDGRPITEGATDLAFTTAKIRDEELLVVERTQRRLDAGGHDVDITNSAPGIDSDSRPNTPLTDEAGTANPVVLTGRSREAASAIRGPVSSSWWSAQQEPARPPLYAPRSTSSHRTDMSCSASHLRPPQPKCWPMKPVSPLTRSTSSSTSTASTKAAPAPLRPPAGCHRLVDEAAMVSTPNLADLFGLAEALPVAAGAGR